MTIIKGNQVMLTSIASSGVYFYYLQSAPESGFGVCDNRKDGVNGEKLANARYGGVITKNSRLGVLVLLFHPRYSDQTNCNVYKPSATTMTVEAEPEIVMAEPLPPSQPGTTTGAVGISSLPPQKPQQQYAYNNQSTAGIPTSGGGSTTVPVKLPGLGKDPKRISCPYCRQASITHTSHEVDACTIIAVIALLLTFTFFFWVRKYNTFYTQVGGGFLCLSFSLIPNTSCDLSNDTN